ncbi:aspartic proteinase CDR1-like [Quillaja saponaria]|uniref:Aspartic proteinase CDR1-like n=1 Tax=Quillaja saponaria TaxID=32244 RepID=A0AAD7PI06_QUISA|nr:aspartic proteinase CDR1-like [Quillaja saponaria]
MSFVFAPIHFLVLLAFSTSCFPPITISITTSPISNPPSSPIAKPQRLVSKLIHPHSVHHPTYNPKDTIEDRAERDMKNSIAPFTYLQASIQNTSLASDVAILRASLFPTRNPGVLLVNISIGQPPIPQLLVVDTGSSLLWVMCIPCSNCHQHSAGLLAHEQLVFETLDEGIAVLSNVTFGCGHDNQFSTGPEWNGVLGLGIKMPLPTQQRRRFSYCIGSITDDHDTYNQLVLGEGADLQGYSTPFDPWNGVYYVTLQGISVGDTNLNIDPKTFERNEEYGTGGVIIDSGTTFTAIFDAAYVSVFRKVQDLMNGLLTQVVYKDETWQLCYRGTVLQDLSGFPVVTFHFALGADLVLDAGSFFYQRTANVFCMAVFPSSAPGENSKLSVIGLLSQQNYNVGYDLEDELIYFQRIECELLNE